MCVVRACVRARMRACVCVCWGVGGLTGFNCNNYMTITVTVG